MEVVVILAALGIVGLLVLRGSRGDQAESAPLYGGSPYLGQAGLPPPRATGHTLLVPGAPPLRIFAPGTAPSEGGAEYSLALARTPGGRWNTVLRQPEVVSDGGALTVTLFVPWRELAERYSAVNLVVR